MLGCPIKVLQVGMRRNALSAHSCFTESEAHLEGAWLEFDTVKVAGLCNKRRLKNASFQSIRSWYHYRNARSAHSFPYAP
jgi:hypothetical protein